MSTLEDPVADVELGQQKRRQRRRRRRQRQSISGAGGSESTTDGSRYFSDSEDDHPSWQSSPEKCGFPDEMERSGGGGGGGGSGSGGSRRKNGKEKTAAAAEEEFDEVDLENGDLEMRVHVSKKRRVKRECRICQMRLVEKGEEDEVGIELGCFCKGDLGDCHKKCAEAWFKLKGDTTCEICGAIAMNVVIEPPVINEADININAAAAAAGAAGNLAPAVAANLDPILELQNYWHGRRVMNAILTCLVLALVISWIFHFNLGSKN
ncbi:uncharacterized protein LOC124913653 [Impatiens glandulifera]|uniref:uncharacterized protein LOC124913653 n=1 Tax=Impatiens glandulifera TaxID=253017 RepID=UPI001FB147B8|nr:uncharacterized protein LOC124913653 [Impatiens glandulifera]